MVEIVRWFPVVEDLVAILDRMVERSQRMCSKEDVEREDWLELESRLRRT